MGQRVNIIFDGVVAVGPAYPRAVAYPKVDGPLFAVMPSGIRKPTRRSTLEQPDRPTYTNVHTPVILTKLQSTGRSPDFEANGWRGWHPLRERLQVLLDGSANPGELTYARTGDVTDIAAVSDIREIFPARSHLKDGMLQRSGPAPLAVASQVFVPKGHVRGGSGGKGTARVTYLPKRTTEPVQKLAAQQIVVEVEAETIAIAATSLDTGERLDTIVFTLTPGPDPAEILIGNADPAEIHNMVHRTGLAASASDAANLDFELFYDIVEGEDGGGLPIPIVDTTQEFLVRPCYTAMVEDQRS